ncbi:MAG: 2'-5' RNA ligase family protein [Lapillicoccus sp.]
MSPWPGTSSLVVPVPALEEWVRRRHHHYDAAYVSFDPAFAHAHITLLSPFVEPAGLTDEVRRRVAGVLSRHEPFEVRLSHVDVFAGGIIHLVPEDDRPLRALTADLVTSFPAYPPYAGRFADVRPHLTLDMAAGGVDVASTRRSLGEALPAHASIGEARLSWYEQHRCRTLEAWPLGAPATERAAPSRSGIEKPPRQAGS